MEEEPLIIPREKIDGRSIAPAVDELPYPGGRIFVPDPGRVDSQRIAPDMEGIAEKAERVPVRPERVPHPQPLSGDRSIVSSREREGEPPLKAVRPEGIGPHKRISPGKRVRQGTYLSTGFA